MLIVNTASNCDFTYQYEGLEKLFRKYKDDGFVVLAFPCNQFLSQEPEEHEDIRKFCKTNYNITFPIFEKVKVNGPDAHPLFKYLKENSSDYGFDESANKSTRRIKRLLKEHYPQYLDNKEIKWNFTKFLVNRNGEVLNRFDPTVEPGKLEEKIQKTL